MIDEKELGRRLSEAAGWQDDLLPRATEDDLAAGRRRLRRRRALTAAGGLGSTAAVCAVVVGLTSWLTPTANPVEGDLPAAATTASATRGPVTDPADPAAYKAQDRAFDQAMRAALKQHLDPRGVHLDYSSKGGFGIDHTPGIRRGGGRVGWRIAGQQGVGYVDIGVATAATATSARCGSQEFTPALDCKAVTLPNGRTAQLGRRGEAAELTYTKADGEFVTLTVNPLWGNNASVPVRGMGITDAKLFALVTDLRVDLPPLTPEEQRAEDELKNFKPTYAEAHAAAARVLTGGTLTHAFNGSVPEQFGLVQTWRSGAIEQTVIIGVDSAQFVSKCSEELGGLTCTETTMPDGRKVLYAEGVPPKGKGKQKYMLGAAYLQPDGNLASVLVQNPGRTPQPGGITKQQVIALATDQALDK
ncbi:hypothetical protein BWI15_06650 [Kribbella sp. ALI-6-A]|uniref:hypothetical protein n=1 Tax=Kribbella sp. ALI-6-A TaxID=1933817 RepID=UPI00097C5876|nr:hypothetical protein [Kribbella sp. ALI-6-A]ONI75524.1 hypothetical protein BWI15_06650 [Kribbella sp. ALI-6-A]